MKRTSSEHIEDIPTETVDQIEKKSQSDNLREKAWVTARLLADELSPKSGFLCLLGYGSFFDEGKQPDTLSDIDLFALWTSGHIQTKTYGFKQINRVIRIAFR